MRALTLWRPWSDAIVRGPKRVENRPWMPPAKMLGKLFAVHAGKTYNRGDWEMPEGYEPPDVRQSPTGIVGVVRLAGYLDMRNGRRRSETAAFERLASKVHFLDKDPWWAGPVGWFLEDVVAIEPVPCRGAMGLWRVPDDVAELVRERLQEARSPGPG